MEEYKKVTSIPRTGDKKPKTNSTDTVEKDAAEDPSSESRSFLSKAKNLTRHSIDSRKRYDYEWMVRNLYLRGYHFSKYQPTTNTITLASRQAAKIPINLLAIQVRSICNQTTSFRPKWECMPEHNTEESKTQARYRQILLDDIFIKQKLKKKIKETVKQGLMYSVGGPWQVVYNKEKKQVEIWTMDTFDFYWDMFSDDFDDCQYQVKAVRRPLDEITKNPDFDEKARNEVHGAEQRLAVSENKQFLVQSMRILPANTEEGFESVILFEGYFKTRDSKGKVNIRKMVWTDKNTIPLVDEYMDDDEFDFVLYQADLWPKEILGEGWMKNTMPINRVIDSVESSIFDYITRVAKGRIIVDKDSGVKAISTVHGEIIRKNRGSEVRNMEMSNLPNAVNLFVERMHKYQEDIGGVHDASLGRLPGGVRSGIGVAELKQSDSSSQDDLVDNLEDFLEEVARKVFKKIAKHYDTYHVIHALGYRESEAKAFAVVGDKSPRKEGNKELNQKDAQGNLKQRKIKIGPDILDLAVIGEDNQVRVTIGSWLGYTKEAAQQKALDLAQAGIISQQEVLAAYEFGNIDEIIQRTRREKLLGAAMSAGPGGAQGGGPNAVDLADTENEMMVNENKDMPVKESDDHKVHIAIHQDALGRGADSLVIKHINIHMMYLGMGPTEGGSDQSQAQQPPAQPMGGPPPGQPQPGGQQPFQPPQGMGQMGPPPGTQPQMPSGPIQVQPPQAGMPQ